MKALMFGWEFPPHILGGLGTASYGLTRGMAAHGDMEITFVIPKPHGDDDRDDRGEGHDARVGPARRPPPSR